MTALVEAVPPATFERWLARQRATAIDLGQETYEGVCAKCHGLAGQGGIGPELAGNALINDRPWITKVIRNGTGTMPPVGRDWSDRQLNAVIDHMRKNLKAGSGGG